MLLYDENVTGKVVLERVKILKKKLEDRKYVSVDGFPSRVSRRVHLTTVLLRPPSGHRPGRRQTHHTHILQIGLRLAIAQADARPVMPIFIR